MPKMPIDNNGVSVPVLGLGAAQQVATSGVSAQSSAVASNVVRLYSPVDCFIATGANPTALTTGHLLPGGTPLEVAVNVGDKVAAILSTGNSTLYISELG